MKKIFFAVFFVIFFAGNSFGAVSSDTQLILSRLDAMNQRIDDKFAEVNQRIDDTNRRIENLQSTTSSDIDSLRTIIYWGLTFLTLFLGSPIYGPALKKFFSQFERPALTVEDIQRMIDISLEKRKEQ